MILERKNRGSGHSYTIDGVWVPGVTTVIGILDRPGLVTWAARESAAFADQHWDRLSGMRSADRIKEIEGARYATNRSAVMRGHRIHAMADRIAHGDRPEVPADIAPGVQAYADLLTRYGFETVATELPVGNGTYGYAGTLDALVTHPRWGACVIDVKTGKGVYESHAAQLSAYRWAEQALFPVVRVGPRGGQKTVTEQRTLPRIDHALVAHIHTTDVELIPVKTGMDVFTAFLAMLDVFHGWTLRTGWDYRDRDEHDYPIGAAIAPEADLPEGY